MIFIDTNVFYNFLFKTPLTERAKRVFLHNSDLCTSTTVLNETIYIICFKYAKDKFGITSKIEFRDYISQNGYGKFDEIIRIMIDLLNLLKIDILPSEYNFQDMLKFMQKYHLLPNDALIALTCKNYGIKSIATFDRDFERVEFLEIVEDTSPQG